MSESNSTDNKVAMDEVAEKRPAAKKTRSFGGLVFLLLLALIIGGAWYYQSYWLPQVKQTYQQARLLIQDIISPEKKDPMAAPPLESVEHEADENEVEEEKPDYAVSAITDSGIDSDTGAMHHSTASNKAEAEVSTEEKDKTIMNAQKMDAPEEVQSPEQAPNQEKALNENSDESPAMAHKNQAENIAAATPAPMVHNAPVLKPVPPATVEMHPAEKQVSVEADSKAADLRTARQAFWQRDLPKAEALYKQQIATAAPNADSWGELGNIYYIQARWKQAAAAYTEAALLLLDKGDFPQAMFMRYIVMGLDPLQVKRIDDHVRAMQAPVNG